MDTVYCLAHEPRNRQDLALIEVLKLLVAYGDCVVYDYLVYGRIAEALDGRSAKHRVRRAYENSHCPGFLAELGGLADRARSGDHVVDHQHGATVNVADHVSDFDVMTADAAFVDDCQLSVHAVGVDAGPLDISDVRADQDEVLDLLVDEVMA